ncbi:hypothetical protein GF366_01185 [Candidatus Peregrinibacteria bacterium]|nr:hypothetical protein [Candidatus Peregrinibacteria bacterium]
MSIDKTITDAMFGTFRNMTQECKDKGLSGENFDKMVETLRRMEQLGEEMDDINAFNAALVEEDLMNKFSQYYGALLSSSAKKEAEKETEKGYDDEKLMARTLKAYEDTVKSLKEQEEKAFAEAKGDITRLLKASNNIIPAIQKVIDLGKSGISYPVFLKKLIEEGLDKALEGQTALRDAIVFEIEINKDFSIPPIIEMHEERLKAFDELAEKSPFNIPEAFEFSLKDKEIYHKHRPKIIKWKAIRQGWEKIFELLYDWLDSFCKFAPRDKRWRTPGASESRVQKNIRRTKGCNPGFLKERERIFNENFGMNWDDIFTHETFKFQYDSYFFPYSDNRFQLIKDTYEYCKPPGKNNDVEPPPEELIKKAEKLYEENQCINPNIEKAKSRIQEKLNKYYGK